MNRRYPAASAALPFHLSIVLAVLTAACSDPVAPPVVPWSEDPERPAGQRAMVVATAWGTRCGHADSGLVFCWGENRAGEFGNGTKQPTGVPVPAAGGMTWRHLFGSVGTPRMCGIAEDGRGYCWGYNVNGEIGDGTMQDQLLPVPVSGDLRFTTMSTAYHTCGVTTAGEVWCWGGSSAGALGSGELPGSFHLAPVRASSPHRYSTVTTGMQFTCALRTSGAADCWGWGVGLGSGVGDRTVYVPMPVSGNRTWTRISAGEEHVCALDSGGAPFCWGKADYAWPAGYRPTPAAVPTRLRFTEVVSGDRFGACALTSEGAAFCWGGRDAPSEVPGRHRFATIASHREGYCGTTPGGSVLCWRWWLMPGGLGLTEPEPAPSLTE